MQGQRADTSRGAEFPAGFPERWVPAFRIAVVAAILVHIIPFVIAVPVDFQQRLDDIAESESNIIEQLQSAGLSATFFAGYLTGVTALCGALFTVLGVLILVRRSNAFMPLFVALVLVTEGTQIGGMFYALESLHSWGRWVAEVMNVLTSTMLVTFFFLFPTGRFVPGWTRWVSLSVIVVGVAGVVVAALNPTADYTSITFLYLIPIFGVMVYAQVHRYRHMPAPADRQRVKWVVVGMVAALATILNPDRGPVAIMFWFTLATIGLALIPLAITIAILRYQLFDIDRLINRTLVYSVVMALLAAAYGASVLLLQSLLGSIAGSSSMAVAAPTLGAVALFHPLRTRVQSWIDRHFYRTRYETALALTRFGHSMRNEVDLERLVLTLCRLLAETMQPAHISLWQRESLRIMWGKTR